MHRAVGDLGIVDPVMTKLKAGYAAKTDRLDARPQADASAERVSLGFIYPPIAIRELRELCRFRLAVAQTRTALIQRLRLVLLRQEPLIVGVWRGPRVMPGSRRSP